MGLPCYSEASCADSNSGGKLPHRKTRRVTGFMPTDRKPEFFKGAQLRVGIIGCGYVGLPLALRFAEAGHKVTGFDTDPDKVARLNAGKTYIDHIPQTKLQ